MSCYEHKALELEIAVPPDYSIRRMMELVISMFRKSEHLHGIKVSEEKTGIL